MKKWTALCYLIIGLQFAACSSQTDSSNVINKQDVEQAASVQTEAAPSVCSDLDVEGAQYANAVPVVYMTEKITAEALCRLYESQGRKLKGEHTAVWISARDLSEDGRIQPELVQNLIQSVDGTLVTCSTQSDPFLTEDEQRRYAVQENVTASADQVIIDEHGSVTIPVEDGVHLAENYVGKQFCDYDGLLVISHFKGHTKAGFDGAVHNISIGMSAAEGKCLIYSAGGSSTDPEAGEQDAFLESMAEAGKSVADALNKNIVYMNIMDHNTWIGDVSENTDDVKMRDIGIAASTDPVALDQACVDLIYMTEGSDPLVRQIEERNGEYVLEYAEEIGLGSSAYTLISIDES